MDKLKKIADSFFSWYERNYTLNLGIASFLFIWQLIHLYWLTVDVVFLRLFGISLLPLEGIWEFLIILADYTEIPALLSTSLIYIHSLTKKFTWRNILFLVFINSQWLHLFWITDEFVIQQFTSASVTILPIYLAWFAILVDYLELPVIYDTVKRFFVSLGRKK